MKVVVDPGSTHLGEKQACKDLIYAAKECGADIIKFQLFSQDMFPQNHALPREIWTELVGHAKEVGIDIFASVFDIGAIDTLVESGVSKIKLSYSYNFNLELIKYAKKMELDIWASGDDNNYPSYANVKFFCVPEYPVKKRLGGFNLLGFDGFSSHLLGIEEDIRICDASISKPKYLEKHFSLNDYIKCPDDKIAINKKDLKRLTKCLHLL